MPVAVPQRFQRYFGANFVPKFEAVRYRLGRTINPYLPSRDPPLLNLILQRLSRESNDPNRRRCNPWSPCFDVDRNPDFVGHLGADLVKREGRKQTDDSLRNPSAHFEQADMLRRGDRFGGIESPLQPLQLPPLDQTRQVIAWNTRPFQILSAHNVLPPNQIRQPSCLRLCHGPSVTKHR